LPLSAYADWSDFKIYLNDVGLLGALGGVPPETLLQGDKLFTEFKGTITEQFVLQQLISQRQAAFYWTPDTGISEVDFVIQRNGAVVPVEVKAAENVRSRSLRVYYDKYSPEVCIRTSLAAHIHQDWMQNVPLYGFLRWLQKQA
jgi:predicted AAA+ superfamily ATPase